VTSGSGYSEKTDVTCDAAPIFALLEDMEKNRWRRPNTNVASSAGIEVGKAVVDLHKEVEHTGTLKVLHMFCSILHFEIGTRYFRLTCDEVSTSFPGVRGVCNFFSRAY
jgi:hypothetical protein